MKLADWTKAVFVMACCMFAGSVLYAQTTEEFKIAGKSYIQLMHHDQNTLPALKRPLKGWRFRALSAPVQQSVLYKQPESIPRAYSYDELGIFCKWEVKMEKAARMPVKFRLGEVQYVERMEGKLPQQY
jgi:hypothetical protein